MQKRAEGGGMSLFLKGILIGLLFGVPVGAVGAMTAVSYTHLTLPTIYSV